MPRRLVYPPRLFWKITRTSVQFVIQTALKAFRICCCCCCCCFAQVVSHFIFTIRILKYGKNSLHLKLLFRCLVFATDQRGIQQVNCAHKYYCSRCCRFHRENTLSNMLLKLLQKNNVCLSSDVEAIKPKLTWARYFHKKTFACKIVRTFVPAV